MIGFSGRDTKEMNASSLPLDIITNHTTDAEIQYSPKIRLLIIFYVKPW